jgi:MFS family permease
LQPSVYRNYLLAVLTVTLLFNGLDRVALGVMLQDIKVDLDLTDTQLGFLSGIAFALFYSVMGIPIARWADRGNRVAIITLTTAFWSVAVALCGIAGSFVQLLLIRVAVAVGEAGASPPAYSLIADYFGRAERPRAAALYGQGGLLSNLIGFFLAGWLNELYGWRWTFVLLGIPGVGLAFVAWFTLKEPRRTEHGPRVTVSAGSTPSLKVVGTSLWNNATFRHLLLCLSVLFLFLYGIFVWLPAFFIRSYGTTTAEVGLWLSCTYGVGGVVGAYIGGELATRYAAQNERLQLRWMAIAITVAGLLSILTYLSSSKYTALALIGISTMVLTTVNGPLIATVQTLVPERMRAVAFALLYFLANLIGMGLGPLVTGSLSDAFAPWAGEESLRYALLLLGPGYFLSAWHAWCASRTVTRDLADVHIQHERTSRETGKRKPLGTALQQ